MLFEYENLILSKNGVFLEKGYYNLGLYVLNISEVTKSSYSSTYIIEFINLWHSRFEHINQSNLKKLKQAGLISDLNTSKLNKCEICVKYKFTKKSHKLVKRNSELLKLIHNDLSKERNLLDLSYGVDSAYIARYMRNKFIAYGWCG